MKTTHSLRFSVFDGCEVGEKMVFTNLGTRVGFLRPIHHAGPPTHNANKEGVIKLKINQKRAPQRPNIENTINAVIYLATGRR